MMNVSILAPFEMQKPGARSWAPTEGGVSTGSSRTLSFLKVADLAGSFAAHTSFFETAFEALNKSKSNSHPALLPAFLGAPLLVRAVWCMNSEGQRKEFLFFKVGGKLLVVHVRSCVRKRHRLWSWGTGEYFIFEGHIFSEAESECDLLLKKNEMEKWKDAPVLAANTFGSLATDVWLPRQSLAFEQCLQVAARSRSWLSGDQAIVTVPVFHWPPRNCRGSSVFPEGKFPLCRFFRKTSPVYALIQRHQARKT